MNKIFIKIKDFQKNIILFGLAILWFCKPVSFETVASHNRTQNRTIDMVVPLRGGFTQGRRSSIFVEGLQSMNFSMNQRKISGRPTNLKNLHFSFNLIDSATNRKIRYSTMLQAHVSCLRDFYQLPREIVKEDRTVKFDSRYQDLFNQQYEKVFGYNIYIEENLPKDVNKKRLKRALKRFFKKYGEQGKENLRRDLFENPCVIKATQCRYRDHFGLVTIYYDQFNDLFGVVDSKSNRLLDFAIATEIDYADIFRYKSVFQGRVLSETSECPASNENISSLEQEKSNSVNEEEMTITFDGEEIKFDETRQFENFDTQKNQGLPTNYNPVDGWWVDRQEEITRSVDPVRFAELSIDGGIRNDITELEALTILQAESQNLVSGAKRPDKINDPREEDLNLDFKISNWNKLKFPGWSPTYVDVKAPIDPEVIIARNEPYQSLETQVDNLLKTISYQRIRAIKYNESVIHMINLLRIKPSDRYYFMQNFIAKAVNQNLDLNGIQFINTSDNTI